jgi:membrane protein involved in colicin uptake
MMYLRWSQTAESQLASGAHSRRCEQGDLDVSTEGDMRRYRAEANKHRADISKASKTVATQRKKATDAMTAAGKTKSAATARSKLAEAERASKAANDAEGKRAGLERKLADAEVKIAKTQERYEKERNASQAKALDDLRKRADLASSQFRPPRRLGDGPPSASGPARGGAMIRTCGWPSAR